MSEIAPANLFFALLDALRPILSAACSQEYALGVTGACALGAGQPALARDLWSLFAPGLEALGLDSEVLGLEESGAEALLKERLRRGFPVPLFAFSGALFPSEVAQEEVSSEPTETPERQSEGWEEPTIHRAGVALAVDAEGRILWRELGSAEAQAAFAPELAIRFGHALRLTRRKNSGKRTENIRNALLRWVAFSAAFPERLPSDQESDVPILHAAAAFLKEIAGAGKSPIPLRRRHAAERFLEGDVLGGLDYLRDATFRALKLPPIFYNALSASPSEPLSEMERRELIYLARAGTMPLRTLAAERLLFEIERDDAWRTLEQLCYDSNYWVRSVARTVWQEPD